MGPIHKNLVLISIFISLSFILHNCSSTPREVSLSTEGGFSDTEEVEESTGCGDGRCQANGDTLETLGNCPQDCTCGNKIWDPEREACDPSAFSTGCDLPALCNQDCSACETASCCGEGFIHCPEDPTAACARPCDGATECPSASDESPGICGPPLAQSALECPSGTLLCPDRDDPNTLICATPCDLKDECRDLPGGTAFDEAFILCGNCPETDCDDGFDNDGDGRTDCGDREDCSLDPVCRCGNGELDSPEVCDRGDNRSCPVQTYCLADCTTCQTKSCAAPGTIHCLNFSSGNTVIPCDHQFECADGLDEGLLNLGFICEANGQACNPGEISCVKGGANRCVRPCDGSIDCEDPENDGISVDENPGLCGNCQPSI